MEGKQPYLGDLLTMVINHILTGMILQVCSGVFFIQPTFPNRPRIGRHSPDHARALAEAVRWLRSVEGVEASILMGWIFPRDGASSWVFPKNGFPNKPIGFPTKDDHFGVWNGGTTI